MMFHERQISSVQIISCGMLLALSAMGLVQAARADNHVQINQNQSGIGGLLNSTAGVVRNALPVVPAVVNTTVGAVRSVVVNAPSSVTSSSAALTPTNINSVVSAPLTNIVNITTPVTNVVNAASSAVLNTGSFVNGPLPGAVNSMPVINSLPAVNSLPIVNSLPVVNSLPGVNSLQAVPVSALNSAPALNSVSAGSGYSGISGASSTGSVLQIITSPGNNPGAIQGTASYDTRNTSTNHGGSKSNSANSNSKIANVSARQPGYNQLRFAQSAESVRGIFVLSEPADSLPRAHSSTMGYVYPSANASLREIGNGHIRLDNGSMLVSLPGPKHATLVDTPAGQLWVGKQADVIVAFSQGVLRVQNLDSMSSNGVRFSMDNGANQKNSIAVGPGFELLGSKQVLDWNAVNAW